MSWRVEVEPRYYTIARNPLFNGILEQLLPDRTVKDQDSTAGRPPTIVGPWPPLLATSTAWSIYELALWPEIYKVCVKLVYGLPLETADKAIAKELSEASGWQVRDVLEDLKAALCEDPSTRVDIYRRLTKKYYDEAIKEWKRGNLEQAGEKLWGASVALVKLHAALKGIFIAHWSRGKIDSYITHNVKSEHKGFFRELIDNAHVLHEYFYEGVPDEETFKERWTNVIDLLMKISKLVGISLS